MNRRTAVSNSKATARISKSAFTALSRFVVANGVEDEVKEAFRNRPHLVDHADGFIRMEVLSPLDRPEEIWLLTYWKREEDFIAWHKSHMYHDSHRGIPQGLKLVPGETEQRQFKLIAE